MNRRFVSAPRLASMAFRSLADGVYQPISRTAMKSSTIRGTACWCYAVSPSAPSSIVLHRTLTGDSEGERDLSNSLVILEDDMESEVHIQELADQTRHPNATLVLSPASSSSTKAAKGSRRRHAIGDNIPHGLNGHIAWSSSSATSTASSTRSRNNQKRHCFVSDPPSEAEEDFDGGLDTWNRSFEDNDVSYVPPSLLNSHSIALGFSPDHHHLNQNHQQLHYEDRGSIVELSSSSSSFSSSSSVKDSPLKQDSLGKKYFSKKKKPLSLAPVAPADSKQSKCLTRLSSHAPSWKALSLLFAEASTRKELHCVHVTAMLTRLSHLQDKGKEPDPSPTPSQDKGKEPDLQDKGKEPDPSPTPSRHSRHSSSDKKPLYDPSQYLNHRPIATATNQNGSIDPSTAPSARSPTSSSPPPKRKPPTSPTHLALALSKEAEALLPTMGLREVSFSLSSLVKLGCITPADKPLVIRFMTRAFHLLSETRAFHLLSELPRTNEENGARGGDRPSVPSVPSGEVGRPNEESAERRGHEAHSLSMLIRAISLTGMKGLRVDWASRFFQAVESRRDGFTSQGIAILFHSLAIIQHVPPPELRQKLLDHLVLKAESCSSLPPPSSPLPCCPVDVSMTIWALAKLRTQPPEDLGSRLLLAMRPQLPLFSSQELAVTQWGMAKLRFHPPASWSRDVLDAAGAQLFTQHEAKGGGALSRRGSPSRISRSTEAVASNSIPPFDSGSAQSISMLLYSSAVLKLRPDHRWLESSLSVVMRESDCFTLQGLASVIYALGLLGYHPGSKWLNRMRQEVSSRSTEASLRARVEDGENEVHPAVLSMLRKGFAMLQLHRKDEDPESREGDLPPSADSALPTMDL